MDQNTLEWLKWRKEGIGSSDVPIILGLSKFKTPYQLWEEKTSTEIKEQAPNYIQQKGHDLEPKVRAMFELKCGESMKPALVQSSEYPWARASLDGFSECKTKICEIKFTGKDDHVLALSGVVPPQYVPQVQWQLLISGAMTCFYLSFDGKTLHTVGVNPDLDYQKKILGSAAVFYQNMVDKTPVPFSDRDYKPLKFRGASALANKYKRLLLKAEALETEIENAKAKLLEQAKGAGSPRCQIDSLKIVNITRVGNVDYKKIPELAGVDLEKYRGKSSNYWKIDTGHKRNQ